MTLKQTPEGLPSLGGADIPCLESNLFFNLLEEEVSRAFRYQFFVSLILFRTPRDQTSVGSDLARFLRAHIRRNDCVGALKNRTLGIILLHSKPETCVKVMQRLKSDFLLFVSKQHPAVGLKASSAVYPSEAESLTSLYAIALKRLRIQKYTDLTVFLITPPPSADNRL